MRLFVAGDTHGNESFLTGYLYPTAATVRADAIIQVGDFGYWEHIPAGIEFLDAISDAAIRHDIPLYWLHGNHDKHSLALTRYGGDGFRRCRPLVNYIPNGFCWSWDGVSMRVFGGAYSPDKMARLTREAQLTAASTRRAAALTASGVPTMPRSAAQTLWFPEEEMTDEEMTLLLARYHGPVDLIFSHDQPAGATSTLTPLDDPLVQPNRVLLGRALATHRPAVWIHGHLHHRYDDVVRHGGDHPPTHVVGLSCDDLAAAGEARHRREAGLDPWEPTDAWCIADIDISHGVRVIPGAHAIADTTISHGS